MAAEMSETIEEANRRRAALGLKPLAVGGGAGERASLEARVDAAIREENEAGFRAHLERLKKKRLLTQKLAGPSLGEELLGGSAAASSAEWVARNRQAAPAPAPPRPPTQAGGARSADAIAHDRARAQQRARELDDEEEAAVAVAADLRVAHAREEVPEEGETVLTLRDRGLLTKSGQLADDEDELVSSELLQRKQAERNVARRKKKGTYDVWTEDKAGILSKYDEDDEDAAAAAAKGFRLGDVAAAPPTRAQREERVRDALRGSEAAAAAVSGALPGSDYLTAEEAATRLRRKSAKGKTRERHLRAERETSLALELEASAAAAAARNLGSRADAAAAAAAAAATLDESDASKERAARYAAAQAKSEDATRRAAEEEAARQRMRVAEAAEAAAAATALAPPPPQALREVNKLLAEEAEDAAELRAALEQARLLQQLHKSGMADEGDGADPLPRGAPRAEEEEEDGGIVITNAFEFARGVGQQEESAREQLARRLREGGGGGGGGGSSSSSSAAVSAPRGSAMKDEEAEEGEVAERRGAAAGGEGGGGIDGDGDGDGEAKGGDESDDELAFLRDQPMPSLSVGPMLEVVRKRGLLSGGGGGGAASLGARPLTFSRLDEFGHEMSEKEAFRFMSRKFHGIGSGKKKTEKRLRKILEEQRLRKAHSSLEVVNSVLRAQQRAGSAFIVLEGAGAGQQLASALRRDGGLVADDSKRRKRKLQREEKRRAKRARAEAGGAAPADAAAASAAAAAAATAAAVSPAAAAAGAGEGTRSSDALAGAGAGAGDAAAAAAAGEGEAGGRRQAIRVVFDKGGAARQRQAAAAAPSPSKRQTRQAQQPAAAAAAEAEAAEGEDMDLG